LFVFYHYFYVSSEKKTSRSEHRVLSCTGCEARGWFRQGHDTAAEQVNGSVQPLEDTESKIGRQPRLRTVQGMGAGG